MEFILSYGRIRPVLRFPAALLLATVLAWTVLAGCGSAPATAMIDSAEREVRVPGKVERIVSLAPSATETLFAIGAGGKLVGVDDFSDYPAAAADIRKVGALSPDIERVVALEPDLVVGAFITAPETIEKIEAAGIAVWIADSTDVRGVPGAIELLGRAIGHGDEAANVASKLLGEIDSIIAIVSATEHRPRVFHELDATNPTKPYTVGPGNFVHSLITLAGGDNIFADAPMAYPQVSFEQVLARNPEAIILADAPFGVSAESVRGRTGWETIDAVAHDRLFAVTEEVSDQMSIPGPRIGRGLRAIAEFLHPELFK